MLKNRKFIVKTFKSDIPIDEDEIILAMQAISSGKPVLLKQGMFNPSTYDSIVEDIAYMRKFREDYEYQIREKRVTEYKKYPDLFEKIRPLVRKLAEDKTINIKKLS